MNDDERISMARLDQWMRYRRFVLDAYLVAEESPDQTVIVTRAALKMVLDGDRTAYARSGGQK